jgi:protein AFG1
MPMDDLRIPVMMGRSLNVQGTRSGLCRINFQELCNTEKGAADYKALCEHFHTVILEDIPQMDMRMHDQARRFITLVDEIYEHRTRFIFSSSVVIEQIFAFEDNEVIEEAAEREKNIFRRENDDEKAKEQGIPITSSWDGPVAAYNPAKMPGLKVQNLCSLLDLHIAFNRAVSRIMEMRSENYLAKNRTLRKIRQHTLHNTLA